MSSWLSILFPPSCYFCNSPQVEQHHSCCNACFEARSRICEPFCAICHRPLHGNVTTAARCQNCADQDFHFNYARSALKHTTASFELIHDLKYNKQLHLSPLIADFCADLIERNEQLKSLMNVTLVPVPLHYRRRFSRGFNQAEEIAKHLSKRTGLPISKLLKRHRYTESQTHFNRHFRQKNLTNAFKTTSKRTDYKNIIIIDDVFTTGSTVNECARMLRKDFPKVENIVVVTAIRG